MVTTDGAVMALDGKMAFEANALYRHPEVAELRDMSEEDAAELEAKEHDLSFIKLDGDVGCMVNGAGLAMATMDIIKTVGGEPANFLDVGGGAEKDQIAAALAIAEEERVALELRNAELRDIRDRALTAGEEDNGEIAPVLGDTLRSLSGN